MKSPVRTPKKPQARTLATKARILDAALEVFTEFGFEKANLDLVAEQAGCSRGAIYAHYASKEEVFLGLRDHRLRAQIVTICARLEEIPDLEKRRATFKRWVVGQIADPFWGILMLEYKLHAVRHPEAREKLLSHYESFSSQSPSGLIELLFGKNLSKSARAAIQRRMAVLGSTFSGLVLESRFRPDLFPSGKIEPLADEIFEVLIRPQP
jgi:AcrR family transcriptional regulator